MADKYKIDYIKFHIFILSKEVSNLQFMLHDDNIILQHYSQWNVGRIG